MNRSIAALGLAAVLLAPAVATAAVRTVTLAVQNMYCSACPYIVEHSLKKVSGVDKVAVSFAEKTAVVTYDDGKASIAALTAATAKAGYPSHPIAASAAN